MTIHTTDPFATPDDDRSPVRRLRGRLPAAVTLWTAYDRDRRRTGLTVSSTLVVEGVPGRLLGIIDEESAAWEAIEQTRHFAMIALRIGDRQLADKFAGVMPAPGGPFRDGAWFDTSYGPVLDSASAWAGCRLDGVRAIGWRLLVDATIEHIALDSMPADQGEGSTVEQTPLVHYRGRYSGAQGLRGTNG
jgi:3-hydroxy-9,10-secoandrosta-1,3,5(10)-triene-9,17-dione monooxygenase reductase component